MIIGIPLKEFVGLRLKMYCLLYDETPETKYGETITCEKEKKVVKGILRPAVKRDLRHEMYKTVCLMKLQPSIQLRVLGAKTMNSM